MEFVVLLLSVLAITLTLVIARPTDTDDTKNGDNYEKLKLILPVAAYNLGDNYEIEIYGTLNLSHENFAATLLTGVEESCKLNFNYERNEGLEISPGFNTEKEIIELQMKVTDKTLTPEFRLTLQAKDNFMDKMFIITLDNSSVGNCKVNSLDNLSHIIFKEGVKKINSIKFTLLE